MAHPVVYKNHYVDEIVSREGKIRRGEELLIVASNIEQPSVSGGISSNFLQNGSQRFFSYLETDML